MKLNGEQGPTVLLYKPFIYLAGSKALALGLGAILLASSIGAASNAHFDGVLDMHVGADLPVWVFLSEGIMNWLCLGIVLLIAGRIISRTSFRTIDLFGTQALARWPAVFIALSALPKGSQRFIQALVDQLRSGMSPRFNPADAVAFVVMIGVTLACVIWMVALMYQSFSISCNVRGAKAIITFIGGLFVAEVLSKIGVYGLVFLALHTGPNAAIRIPGVAGEWTVLSGDREQWSWTTNVIFGHSTTGDSLLASTKRYGDVTIVAMVSTTNREASLALRLQDGGNGYIAVFVPDDTPGAGGVPRITLLKRKFGKETELAMYKKAGLSGPGKPEELTFAAKGPQLEVRLNGMPVLNATDATFLSGFVGLRVYGDIGIPCDGIFSNLTVR